MSIAIDFGSYRFRSLRRSGDQLVARHCRSRYSVLPDSPKRRSLLEQVHIPYAVCEDQLVILGDASVDYARLFQMPSISFFPKGRFSVDAPPGRQVLGYMIESLLPQPVNSGELCCMTVPGEPENNHAAAEFLTRIVRLHGFTPKLLTSGKAVALAELVSKSFTGLAICFGGGSCEISLTLCGTEIARCTTAAAGDWIDEQLALAGNEFAWDAAGNRYLDVGTAEAWKVAVRTPLLEPEGDRETLRSDLYRKMVRDALTEAAVQCADVAMTAQLSRPVSVVITGGAAQAAGFSELFHECLREIDWPFLIGDCRVVTESNFTVVRGCLIHAELESMPQQEIPLAA